MEKHGKGGKRLKSYYFGLIIRSSACKRQHALGEGEPSRDVNCRRGKLDRKEGRAGDIKEKREDQSAQSFSHVLGGLKSWNSGRKRGHREIMKKLYAGRKF